MCGMTQFYRKERVEPLLIAWQDLQVFSHVWEFSICDMGSVIWNVHTEKRCFSWIWIASMSMSVSFCMCVEVCMCFEDKSGYGWKSTQVVIMNVIWCESRTHTIPNEVKGWGAVEALPLPFGSPHSRLPRTEYECTCMDQCALLCWHTLFLLWCVTHQGELHRAALGCKAERVAATCAKLWLCVDAVLARCCSYVCIFLVTMYIYTGFLLSTFASCHWKSTGLTFCYSPSYSHQAYTHTSKMCRQTRAARWRDYPQQGQPKSRPCCPYATRRLQNLTVFFFLFSSVPPLNPHAIYVCAHNPYGYKKSAHLTPDPHSVPLVKGYANATCLFSFFQFSLEAQRPQLWPSK